MIKIHTPYIQAHTHAHVSTQTCVPHIVVHWTPNYICKLQSFSNEKEYYFMERIIHFLLIKENRNTNKQKTTLGILKDVVIRMRPEYSFFLSGLRRFLGCGRSELSVRKPFSFSVYWKWLRSNRPSALTVSEENMNRSTIGRTSYWLTGQGLSFGLFSPRAGVWTWNLTHKFSLTYLIQNGQFRLIFTDCYSIFSMLLLSLSW